MARAAAATADGLDDLGLLTAGALEPPIRSVLFGRARFEQHGRSLARTHEVVDGRARGHGFFPRLADNIGVLQRAIALLERQARDGQYLGPAAHWLLDNAALIGEQAREIRQGLPRGFFRLLPRLRDEPLAGLPRIYGVAWAWVAHTDSGFDPALLEAYLQAYREERELSLAELWALPTTLRVVLVENLRRLAERAGAQQAARETAHHWFDRPDDERDFGELDRLEALTKARGVCDVFLLMLDQRESELPPDQADALARWLLPRLPDPTALLAQQQSEATEDQQSVRNAITTLRHLDRTDWRSLFGRVSTVMKLLQRSPVHAAEREDTQDQTMHAVERLARAARRSETDVASALLALTQHAAADTPEAAPVYWWAGPGERRLRETLGLRRRWLPAPDAPAFRRGACAAYFAGLALLSAAGVGWLMHRHVDPGAPGWLVALAALLMLGPVGETVVAVANRLISESARPARLPRLAFSDGIPATQRVLVVIPCLLTDADSVAALAAQLEQHRIANPEREAQFALLSDYADADAAERADDAALLAAAQAAIDALNRRYPVADGAPLRFLLLHRTRVWSETEGRWIGWERKRGKLEQLVRHLVEGDHAPFVDLGALSRTAPETRYVVTLDSDTDMPPGRLRSLVGVAAHPLNVPRIDAASRRVVAGYGILQPRLMTPLPAPGTVTPYHQLFSGQCGIDPYSAATSEIYQDVFGEGTFTGKGLLSVDAVHKTLVGRLPEGQVLSHDLLEGAIARCAGVSDVVLVEDAPVHADVAASRLHRWTRGDWQLLPFLWQRRGLRLSAINRWKMVDNLRRSLVVPMALALLLLTLASGVLPLAVVLGAVAAAFGAGPLLGAIAGLAPSRDDIALRRFYWLAGADLARALMLAVWHVAQLLQLGLLYGDAIGRALHRQFVSRRHLLQWTTAAAAQAAARTELTALLRAHRRVPLTAAALLVALGVAAAAGAPVEWAAAVVLLLVWAASPLWTWIASRPRRRREHLDEAARDYLHGVARDTWRYYERHVGAADNHLPPDNVQLVPHTLVAHRTSPTNIGMYLLATACARELGFIGSAEMAERIGATLATLDKLARHRGHFYNWYDTQTLAVLPPAYVSTVDSGNCSGQMLALAVACERAAERPDNGAAMRYALLRGRQRLRALQPVLANAPTMRTLAELADGRWEWPLDADAVHALQQRVRRARGELDALSLGRGGSGDDGDDGSMWLLHDLVATIESALADRIADTEALASRLRDHAVRLRAFALAPDFGMLYDRERKLLYIGWRGDSGQLDENHYDLLASEARLTSLVAIAKADVPVQHWAALGRPFFADGVDVGLKSWSGSMFEYLMPSLVLAEPVGSVLHQVTLSAVVEQTREARDRGTPWGISESAIAGQDHTLAYQYGPQGVARLALRRTPRDERVVAPYATALALLAMPARAVANLQALQQLGARGAFGFIEALDYTPQRQSAGGSFVAVQTFMAHHQAMSLVAITDVIADGGARRWASADPWLRAVSALLHERAPREVAVLRDPPPPPPARRARIAHAVLDSVPLADALAPTQLLTNGRYAVLLRSHGGGSSHWDGLGLTRWRDDLLRDACGTFFYVQRVGEPERRSLTARPAPDPEADYRCRMQTDRVVFDAVWPDLQTRCTAWVSPEDDCELRQLELTNVGNVPLTLALSSAAEVTLAPQPADEAHPAFSNLFVQARWDAAEHALYLRRQPRLNDEQAVQAVHFLAHADGPIDGVEPCTDRARWLGRYGSPAHPSGDAGATALAGGNGHGHDAHEAPGVPMDTGLDPMAVLTVRVRLAPSASIRLTFCAAAGRDADLLGALVDKYRQPSHVARASSMSHTMAGIRLREFQLDADAWTALLHVNTLLTSLVTRELPLAQRAAAGSAQLRCDRRLLWRHGISGDRPIVLVTISGEEGLGLAQTLKKAQRLWALASIGVDLVVCNAEPASYLSPVQNALIALRERLRSQQDERMPAQRRPALHLLRDQDLGADERHTLQTLARLRLFADGRPLAQQVERLVDDHRRDHQARSSMPARPLPPLQRAAAATPPEGSFGSDGDFSFAVSPSSHPARPWINVLANQTFGCQVSEVGAGYTWADNSRMHMVTGWSNDALSDPAGEWLLLHDLDRNRVWPLGRALFDAAPREVVHGIGSTRMRQQFDGIDVTLTWCVDAEASLKQVQVVLRCDGTKPRRLRLVAFVEWVMGSARNERLSLATRAERVIVGPEGVGLPAPPTALALQATQLDQLGGFGDTTAFIAWRQPQPGDQTDSEPIAAPADDWTCDRREFFDSAGRIVLPARLGRQSGAGLDACAALACTLTPAAGRANALTLLLGHAPNPQAASVLLADAWRVDPAQRLARQRGGWQALAGGLKVETPDSRFDALVNHWLPYQVVACRIRARAAFYQAGGAFGYRDQLQDAMSMIGHAPELLARQLHENAARQFAEGDVQHWWHAPGGAGVRTHFSDDLLWLPLALALYVKRTGDARLLDDEVPFLAGAQVPEGAEDIYETPAVSDQVATLYEHGARAIDHSLRTGRHGLPLFGTGDWNDGMNRVGNHGQGESVWLAWFVCQVVDDYLPLAEARNDGARVAAWSEARRGWARALDDAGWDGAWYRRGFFDDGSPLGSAANAECRIDLIAQAWSVLTGAGDPQRARQAMASAGELLVDRAANLVRLLDPPLQHAEPSAGYIQAYPPGVRENGGQYNHGAVWALMALARLGDGAGAWQMFTALSPAHRWADAERGAVYAIEPYVMAGDIYTQPPYVGRGGWSWYTGAAGWLLRAAIESICGVVVARGRVSVVPCLPPHWPQASVDLRHGERSHRIVVCADEAGARATCSRLPKARRARVGEEIDLAGLADGSVHIVAATDRAAVDPAVVALPDRAL